MLSDAGKRDFFISYTKDDAAWAEWTAEVLVRHGYTVYIQAWDIRPGDDFVTRMNEFLQLSHHFIAIWSDAYLQSDYCRTELNTAFRQRMNGEMAFLFPVRVQETPLDPLFGTIVAIDLFGLSKTEAETVLLDGLTRRNGKTTPGERKKESSGKGGEETTVRRPGCSVSIVVSFLLAFSIISVFFRPQYMRPEHNASPNITPSYSNYRITVVETPNGDVRTNVNHAEKGQTVTVRVSPDDGYKLASVTVRDSKGNQIEVRGDGLTRVFTMPARRVTVKATFTRLYYIVAQEFIHFESGWVEAFPRYVLPGTTVTLIAHPEEGYTLKRVKAYDGKESEIDVIYNEDGSAKFIMPSSDVRIYAEFVPLPLSEE